LDIYGKVTGPITGLFIIGFTVYFIWVWFLDRKAENERKQKALAEENGGEATGRTE
jgi:hypothetical protein